MDLGSTCTCDVAVLQAFSRRIHYGKFVAEAKFLAEKEKFSALIRNNDAEGLMEALTHPAVEEKVVQRVHNKASHYGTDGSEQAVYKVQPDVIARLYKDVLIPLNKQVQVQYLLQRLDRPTFAYSTCSSNSLNAGKQHFGEDTGNLECASITAVFKAVASNMVSTVYCSELVRKSQCDHIVTGSLWRGANRTPWLWPDQRSAHLLLRIQPQGFSFDPNCCGWRRF